LPGSSSGLKAFAERKQATFSADQCAVGVTIKRVAEPLAVSTAHQHRRVA
jgi:hypothetical protein